MGPPLGSRKSELGGTVKIKNEMKKGGGGGTRHSFLIPDKTASGKRFIYQSKEREFKKRPLSLTFCY